MQSWEAGDARYGQQVKIALWAMALGALAVRVAPFLREGGAASVPSAYDDGVYFAAASLLSQGQFPYRDFTFVHPPGLLLLLQPFAWAGKLLGISFAFMLSRWGAALLGAASTLLVGRLGFKLGGPAAALVAAACYALSPDLVQVERGPFLEPALNFAVLAMALFALGGEPSRRRLLWAGVLGGVALSVKLWAALWLLPLFVALPFRRAALVALAAGVTAGALVLPFAALSPGSFFEQVVAFQFLRPPDGVGRLMRLTSLFDPQRALSWMLAFLGAGMVLRTRSGISLARFATAAYALTFAALLAAASYWGQYIAFLAPSEALLAGLGAVTLLHLSRPLGIFLLAAGLFVQLRRDALLWRPRADDERALAQTISKQVPIERTLFSFEPAWTLRAGRIASPPVIDPYAHMLLGVLGPNAASALLSEPAQRRAREALERFDFLVLGRRGREQLSSESKAWVEARFHRTFETAPGRDGLDLWARTVLAPTRPK